MCNENRLNNSRLVFGTGGIRAKVGVAPDEFNTKNIRKITQGLACFLKKNLKKELIVGVIAYDSRNDSKKFAEETAKILCYNNIQVYIFESLRPTPELSYAIQNLKADFGVVITASHNPSNYNGYKVYDKFGVQALEDWTKAISNEILVVDEKEILVERCDEIQENNYIKYIGKDVDIQYLKEVVDFLNSHKFSMDKNLKIVYTPLHGSGITLVPELLENLGYLNYQIVNSQARPDGNFPTVVTPNPEEPEALKLAIEQAEQTQADIVLGTDPDCDRVGIAIKTNSGEYQILTGNQIGALLINYFGEISENIDSDQVILKTIVTSDFGSKIASNFGFSIEETLTGFKYIGAKICEYEKMRSKNFIFAYEESYGFLSGSISKDKDGVLGVGLIIKMVDYYLNKGFSLDMVIQNLYAKYGYHLDYLDSIVLENQDQIDNMLSKLKDVKWLKTLENLEWFEDYNQQKKINMTRMEEENLELPRSNVVKLIFKNGDWVAVRPSGTEPKFKFYYALSAKNEKLAAKNLKNLQESMRKRIGIDFKC